MKTLNWNNFECKFNGKEQNSFQRLAYAMFYSRFKNKYGFLEHKNQIELAKIKSDFTCAWIKNGELLEKLYTYTDFRNEIIARDILIFLNINVSSAARSDMPFSIVNSN